MTYAHQNYSKEYHRFSKNEQAKCREINSAVYAAESVSSTCDDLKILIYYNCEDVERKSFHVYVPGCGFKKGINKAGYVQELKFLISRLVKTEGNWTSNSPAYDDFSSAAKELPDQIDALKRDTDISFDKLRLLMQPMQEAADQYFRTHRAKPLDSRQMERVKIINRFRDLAKEIDQESVEPGKNLDYRIAEKLVTAGCIRMKRGDLLMNDEYRTTCIQNTLNSPAFKESMKRYDEAGKMNILKMSGKSAIRLLGNRTEPAHREVQAENAPVQQPQVHN